MNAETTSHKRFASIDSMSPAKKKKTFSQINSNDSPINGTRITDWDEFEKWKEIRGDIEPTMNYVEITPEAVDELKKIKNIIGDYICQLCKVKYENAFALAMHKCPRVVHIEFRCPECDKTFNCPANLASHRRWHKPQSSTTVSAESSSSSLPRKSLATKPIRCSSSRSDSRSTNTSTSTVSDPVIDYSTTTTTTADPSKKESMINNNGHLPPRILPSLFQPFANSYLKHSSIFADHRLLPLTIPPTLDLRRLQSSCIFCHEQFAELNHLIQHIRQNHSVSSNSTGKTCQINFDKFFF